MGSERGQKTGVRKGLASLKKPFHFFQELICLPISTAHGVVNDPMTECVHQARRNAFFATLPSVRLLFVLVELGPPGMAHAPAHSPEQGPASPLVTFLDLDDLSRHQAMCFAVDRFSGLFARSLDQAKNRARAFIEPVLLVIGPILLLNFQISCMRICDRLLCQSFQLTVDVHVECHDVRLLCSYYFFAAGIPAVVSHHQAYYA